MPVAGLVIGHSASSDLGSTARPFGGSLLGVAGAYMVLSELLGRSPVSKPATPSVKRLVLIGAAMSADNFVIGFALGTYRVNLVVAALTIGTVSVALSLLGLELGSRIGRRLGTRSELLGGIALMAVGTVIGTGLL